MADAAEIELGPKMLACSGMERAFVLAYVSEGDENATAAARAAGFVDNQNGSIQVTAHRLIHRERVLEAIEEVGRKLFRGQLSLAIAANRRMLEKPDHPDHHKAVQATLSRLGLAERVGLDVNLSGEVTVNRTDATLDALRMMRRLQVPREVLLEHFGHTGLPRYEKMLAELDAKAPKVIEHEPDARA